ncbi:hypothetical protein, partial [Escherichia coli]|uniref:hypothetical protein n=1 Tax=Escherichia coli TaxID=562 RepID=UPI001BB08B80
ILVFKPFLLVSMIQRLSKKLGHSTTLGHYGLCPAALILRLRSVFDSIIDAFSPSLQSPTSTLRHSHILHSHKQTVSPEKKKSKKPNNFPKKNPYPHQIKNKKKINKK